MGLMELFVTNVRSRVNGVRFNGVSAGRGYRAADGVIVSRVVAVV